MEGRTLRAVPTSLKAIAASDAEASLSEEPSAVIPHAGIRAGEGRVTALPTATRELMYLATQRRLITIDSNRDRLIQWAEF